MCQDRETARRHRAACEQIKRMFRDPKEGPQPASSIPNEVDEEALEEELEELEALDL